MTQANEPLSATTSYGYDATGNLTSLTDPRSNTTTFAYDDLGRLTQIDQPLSQQTSFTYDPAGNRLSKTTAQGTLDYSYDAADRLTEVSNASTTLRSFGYDAANRLTTATDADAKTVQIGYDDDDLVTSIDDDRGETASRTFDSRGNLLSQTDGRGTISYTYDPLNRLTQLTDPQSNVVDFSFDPEGNLTEADLPNGVVTTNTYDDNGRLTQTESVKSPTTIASLSYDYDAANNRISQTDNRLAEQTTYTYDDLNRLTSFDPPGAGSTAYAYDTAGNRIQAGSTTYTFNELNQLTGASDGTSYTYDGAGRLIEADDGAATTAYGWDLLDQLASVDDGGGSIAYSYDALGRRTVRDDGSAAQVAHYGDLTDIPTLDTNGSGQTLQSYVQGVEGLVEQRAGGATDFPLPDAHGDVTTLTDAAGAVDSRQTYDPWGEQLSGPSLQMGWLGAQQRRSDPATGLVQMGVRSYDPALGSFMSEDTVMAITGIGASANRFSYTWDNPVNWYDLDGRMTRTGGGGGILPSDPAAPTAKPELRPGSLPPNDRFRNYEKPGLFKSAHISCGIGPFGYTWGENYDNTQFSYPSISIESGFPQIKRPSLRIGCAGFGNTGYYNGDPGSVGVQACFAVCVAVNSDTGVSFGGGFEFGVEFDLPSL